MGGWRVRAGRWLGLMAAGWLGVVGAGTAQATPAPMPVRVMIVSMFGPEGQVWRDQRNLSQAITVPGLSPDYPEVHCGPDKVCQVTLGMGHANAAASIMALAFSKQFDLTHTYWLIAGIAGINPKHGTVGSVAWARWLVEWGIQWELDAREKPKSWPSGYLGINTRSPDEKPPLDYRTEVFQLDGALQRRAYQLSKSAKLADSDAAKVARAAYPAPANQPPSVLMCDTMSGDTWFSGTKLGERAEAWTRILTDGKGRYCTTQQEDNAVYEALKRADAAGLVDTKRVADLRAGSDFDRPAPGGSNVDNLLDYQQQGGFVPALQNLVRAGNPLVNDIVKNWGAWKSGVPSS